MKKVYGRNDPTLKNNSIKQYFSQIECHPLVRPVFKESDVAHVMDLPYESLREEFRTGVETLVKRVLKRPKLKTIGTKHMTGSMLLGIAMEYTEAINSRRIPTILDSFERVAHAEAQKYVDDYIEKIKKNISLTVDEKYLPLNETELDEIFNKFYTNGMKNLAFKLYDTVSVNAFLEVLKTLTKSLKEDFKVLNKKNYDASLKYNYEKCISLSKNLNIQKIKTVEDIDPSFIDIYYEQYYKLCEEYEKSAIGPAKTEAFCKFIDINFNNSHQLLLEDIDLAYKEHINNIQIQIGELQAGEQKWISILNNLKNSIIAAEEQKSKLEKEKRKLGEDIEYLQKNINDSQSEHSKKIELRIIELGNNQKILDTKISEQQKTINHFQKEIEELEVSLQNNKDQKLSLQREKIKEVSTR